MFPLFFPLCPFSHLVFSLFLSSSSLSLVVFLLLPLSFSPFISIESIPLSANLPFTLTDCPYLSSSFSLSSSSHCYLTLIPTESSSPSSSSSPLITLTGTGTGLSSSTSTSLSLPDQITTAVLGQSATDINGNQIYNIVKGDFSFTIKLNNVSSNNSGVSAGLFIRHTPPFFNISAPPSLPPSLISLYWSPIAHQEYSSATTWFSRTHSCYCNSDNANSFVAHYLPPFPLWLKLIRLGPNFASHYSVDGANWVQISNYGGASYPLMSTNMDDVNSESNVDIGVFLSSGDDSTTTTASFDHFSLLPLSLPYESSYIGNTFSSSPSSPHVPGVNALYVNRNDNFSTLVSTTYYDEGGTPVVYYRDGVVVGSLPIGNPMTSTGSITGLEQSVYVVNEGNVIQIENIGDDLPYRQLSLSRNFINNITALTSISGLCATHQAIRNESLLYFSDWDENCIRISTLDQGRNSYHHRMNQLSDVVLNMYNYPIQHNITYNPLLAPAKVYQTLRTGEYFGWYFPHLLPSLSRYFVRLHLMNPSWPSTAGTWLFPFDNNNWTGGGTAVWVTFSKIICNGQYYCADTYDYPSQILSNKNGDVAIAFNTKGGGVAGVEIFLTDTQGNNPLRVISVNAGGSQEVDTVSGFAWSNDLDEYVASQIPFSRPGDIRVDSRGVLWVIRQATDFPIGNTYSIQYNGGGVIPVVVDGSSMVGSTMNNKMIHVAFPTAIAYDAINDILYVAEGEYFTIHMYNQLDVINSPFSPTLKSILGQRRGILSGKRGYVYDKDNGYYNRFQFIKAMEVDNDNGLYVSQGLLGSDLRRYEINLDNENVFSLTLDWWLWGLPFCNVYDVDPQSDGEDVYTQFHHIKLDLTDNNPATRQTVISFNYDWTNSKIAPLLPSTGPSAAQTQSILRRLGSQQSLFLFTSGQGYVDTINWYRYEGEIAIPCGGTRGISLWIDDNGDGIENSTIEYYSFHGISSAGIVAVTVGSVSGDLYLAFATNDGCRITRYNCSGVMDNGVLQYDDAEYMSTSTLPCQHDDEWSEAIRMEYIEDDDMLILYYPIRPFNSNINFVQYNLTRIDGWRRGNSVTRWTVTTLDSVVNSNRFLLSQFMGHSAGYNGMQQCGEYIFMAYLFGDIHAYSVSNGQLLQTFPMGPEVGGQNAWEDSTMGLRCFQRNNGEYMIFTENSGWGNKVNMIRFTPGEPFIPDYYTPKKYSPTSVQNSPIQISSFAHSLVTLQNSMMLIVSVMMVGISKFALQF